jgi:hypothetical protein
VLHCVSLSNVRRLVRTLKTLDVYPKTEDDLAVKTGSGGLISIVSMTIIAFLLLSEIYNFLSTHTVHSILVDTRPSAKLPIHFDITFPSLRCSETAIDVMDVSGDVQVAAEKNIHRIRLDSKGNRIGLAEYEDHAHDSEPKPDPNLNPMLAALGLAFPPSMGGPDAHEDQRGEGCQIVGMLSVNKVAGNVHIALGGQHGHGKEQEGGEHGDHDHGEEVKKSTAHGDQSHGGHGHGSQGQQHVHQFMIHDLASYNCSHRIDKLAFGPPIPGATNPLEGVKQTIGEGEGTAHYQVRHRAEEGGARSRGRAEKGATSMETY